MSGDLEYDDFLDRFHTHGPDGAWHADCGTCEALIDMYEREPLR